MVIENVLSSSHNKVVSTRLRLNLMSVVHSFARCQTLDLGKDTHIFDLDKINAFF